MRPRTVRPAPVRIPLSDGDYIDIKHKLNTGETHAMFRRSSRVDDSGRIDMMSFGFSKVLAYLLAWSFTDDDGTPLAYSIDMSEDDRSSAINNIDPDSFIEVREAVDAHIAKMEKETTDSKNAQATASASPVTSPSAAS